MISGMEEFEKVRQDPNGFKRYFFNEDFDLYIWYRRKGGEISGFQLIYDKATVPRALTCIKGEGYRHNRIDGFDSRALVSVSPILVADGLLDTETLLERFRRHSRRVDPDIVDLVEKTIREYSPSKDDQSV